MTEPAKDAGGPSTVLLVDDDQGFREVYRELLSQEGYDVVEAKDGPSAESALARTGAELIVLDLMLPPEGTAESGVALCRRLLSSRPGAKVIVVSGTGETRLALATVEHGAYDFLSKPVDPGALIAVLVRARARAALEARVAELEASLVDRGDGLLGQSAPFLEARRLAERVAPTDVPVLITGDTGTGKEVFARFLVSQSRRAGKPFVTVNCAALPPTLLESTLFGHRKGAFTGAVRDAPGLFVEANTGTLFLDEIGDLDLPLQVKLLRALEAGEVLPVGASQPVHVDVRILTATHRDLRAMAEEGTFREDLYWRIRGIEVSLPRLADRTGDLPLLAAHFLRQAKALVPGAANPSLSPDALRAMEVYGWPGNLRELRHEMQRALVLATDRTRVAVEDLSPSLRGEGSSRRADDGSPRTLEERVAEVERHALEEALIETGGNKSKAAELLGLSRQGLLNKLDRHGLR